MSKLTPRTAQSITSEIDQYQLFSQKEHPMYKKYAQVGLAFPPFDFKDLHITDDLNLNLPDLDGFLPPINFINCTFSGDVSIEDLSVKSANFFGCTFEKLFSLAKSTITEVSFFNTTFCEQAVFQFATFKNRTFFQQTSFSDADFFCSHLEKKLIFQNCTISQKLSLKGVVIHRNMLVLDKVPIEKIILAPADIEHLRYENIKPPTWEKVEQAGVLNEAICRAWKIKAKALGDDLLASQWHIFEKNFSEIRLKKEDNHFFLHFLLRCYRRLSHFGESPARATIVLAVVLTAISVGVSLAYIGKWKILIATNKALGFIPFITKLATPIHQAGMKYLQIIWQAIITLQLSLLSFSIRNKFQR